jgi:hypothetical protein
LPRTGGKGGYLQRPVVKRSWIKVSPGGPHQRVSVGVQANLRKHRWISQGPEDLSEEDRAEIDDLLGSVVEPDSQAVRSEQLE